MIYHLNLTYLDGISGGDRYLIELAGYLRDQGMDNTIITTESGAHRFQKMGLEEGRGCGYITIPDCLRSDGSAIEIFGAYILRTIRAQRFLSALRFSEGDLLYCHNEFFPNVISLRVIRKRSPGLSAICHLHMTAPNLWKGYKGHFTGRHHIPSLRLIHYHFEQYIFRRLVDPKVLIVTNSKHCRATAERWLPKNRVYNISNYGGVEAPRAVCGDKSYDLVWCGRFHEQKGLPLAVEVLGKIKRKRTDVRMAIIGSGKPWERRLKKMIEKGGLQDNVEMLGFLDGELKFEVMNSSKVFLMTSLFESHGQVNLEAMKCGLPVVAFDLPPFEVFEQGMIRVPTANTEAMAGEAVQLLEDHNHYASKSAEAFAFAEAFSWQKTAAEVLEECIAARIDDANQSNGRADDQ